MKKYILICIVVGLAAGQASAASYELNKTTAKYFQQTSVISSTDIGNLGLVIDKSPGTVYYSDGTVGSSFGATMQGAVGYVATLGDGPDPDQLGTILIGSTSTGVVSGTYNRYRAYVANDNDDPWQIALYVDDGSVTTFSSFVTVLPNNYTWINYDLGSDIDFSTLKLGIAVRGIFTGLANAQPSNPDIFHVSVVPVPAAVLLGILGLGVAGLKLRKHA
jgi:hypothetical protein